MLGYLYIYFSNFLSRCHRLVCETCAEVVIVMRRKGARDILNYSADYYLNKIESLFTAGEVA